MNAYSPNRAWSDAFLPYVKGILADHLLTIAPDPIDWFEATDLLVTEGTPRRIAVRIRRPGYAETYPYDFTIRCKLPSGNRTELDKIVDGHGDLLFYGHACNSGPGLARWWLFDLRDFRAALIRHAANGYPLRFGEKANPDGTRFKWFDVRSFPEDLVVAHGSVR